MGFASLPACLPTCFAFVALPAKVQNARANDFSTREKLAAPVYACNCPWTPKMGKPALTGFELLQFPPVEKLLGLNYH